MFGQRFGGGVNQSSSSSVSSHRTVHNDTFNDQFQDRVFIRELQPGVPSKKIVGLVITKTESRSFPDRKNAGQFRYNLSFTIRDTADDFINVTCWGSDTFIENITQSFHTGDVVEINKCMVQSKQNNEFEENYRPATPTPLQIVVNESHATVVPFSGPDFTEFTSIAYIPVKDSNDYYTLGDVIANGNSLHGTYINILAVVRHPGETKDITTKTGRQMKRREVKLFDESCLSFPLMMWDGEQAEQGDIWASRESVLFLCDVKVTFDDFRRKMISTCTSKTIIITNPDTPEAHHLYSYAQTVNVMDDNYTVEGENHDIDLTTIKDVYSLRQLEEKLDSFEMESVIPLPFTGIIYGCISDFNIDLDDGQRCIITRCTLCKRRVDRDSGICSNEMCASSATNYQGNGDENSTMRSLEIRLSLCDQTHGISGFVMSRKVVEEFLQCNVDSFDSLDTGSRIDLKWRYLFERFKVYFKAQPPRNQDQKPYLSILSISEPDIGEIIREAA